MFDQKRDFMGANFEHCASSFDLTGTVSKTGVEKSGVVNAKFTVGRVEGNHFGGEVGRNPYAFSGAKNIKIARLKNQILVCTLVTNFPKFLGRIMVNAI